MANIKDLQLTEAHLTTLTEVVSFHIDNEQQWADDYEGKDTGDSALDNVDMLAVFLKKLQAREVLTVEDVRLLRGWVISYLRDFVAYWTADFPEVQEYRDTRDAVLSLDNAMAQIEKAV